MSNEPSVTAAETSRAVFGKVLKHFREEAGLSQGDLAKLIPCDRSLVSRIEAGTRVPGEIFAVASDKQLGTGKLFAKLWGEINWYANVDHPDWFKQRAAMDAVATAVREYQTQVIPGLLQTEEYARTLFARVTPESEMDKVEERVTARLSRQQRFLAPDGPLLVAVLDESCIRRVVGSPEVMRDQLDHLLTVGMLPNIRIQIAPFSFAKLVPPNTSMSLLALPDGSEWVYSESLDRGHLNDDPTVIAQHRRTYDLLRADALSARESAIWISKARGEYGTHDSDTERDTLA
ncbi:helix-turn-helix domain-containing protein [Peterkaempfera bronchialis]|uniref:helix-turn-helix domain-containing protein n=1 Tax=Peterkaempfera bronchialis TaxID=2126346 RepID=UPI003C2ADDDF